MPLLRTLIQKRAESKIPNFPKLDLMQPELRQGMIPHCVCLLLLSLTATVLAETTNKPSETVHLWPPGGIYTNFIGVTFKSTDGHTHYTLDGSPPNPSSPRAFRPFLITSNVVVQAQRFKRSKPVSLVVSQAYTVVKQPISEFRSTLPLVIINTLADPIPTYGRKPGYLGVIGLTNGQTALNGPLEYNGRAEIGLRGSSSRRRAKKPYRIELQNERGEDLKVPLLGMPAGSDWILLPEYTDITLARDALVHNLWRQMGYYAARSRYVELFVVRDGALTPSYEHYEGVYLLIEKIKPGKTRLNLSKLKPTDTTAPQITGGYIIKKDRLNVGETGFTTSSNITFSYEYPKEDSITDAQKQWISNHLDEFEAALYGPNYRDPTNGYRGYIDVRSFIDYHWLTEFSLNLDGYGFSVFLHKDRGGKIKMGPIWDGDLCFANAMFHHGFRPDGWQWDRFDYPFYDWYDRLFNDPDFVQSFSDHWSWLRENTFALSNVLQTLDTSLQTLEGVVERNYQRWPSLAPFGHSDALVGTNYQVHVDYLKRWIEARLQWIDGEGFPAPEMKSLATEPETIELTCKVGTIHFTTDGSDPRLPGGRVSARSLRYTRPIHLSSDQQLVARVQSPFALWSPPLRIQGQRRLPAEPQE